MELIDTNSALWSYLPDDLKGLLEDGERLLINSEKIPNLTDYSYMVFPFSKAYEGFLKRLFLNLHLIKDDEYYGDEIRIGRILNPGFIHEHQNVFNKLTYETGNGTLLAKKLWDVWTRGRNQVFHYFPHNFRKLSYSEAHTIIKEIIALMDEAVMLAYIK